MKHKHEKEQQSPVATQSVHEKEQQSHVATQSVQGYSPVLEYHRNEGVPTDFHASVYKAKH